MSKGFIKDNFESEGEIRQVHQLKKEIDALNTLSSLSATAALQRGLVTGLRENMVGKYSKFHENAIYAHGYDDPRTLDLAHK